MPTAGILRSLTVNTQSETIASSNIHFMPANGMPVDVYKPVFERIQKLVGDARTVAGSDYFPYCERVRDNRHWQVLVDKVIGDIETFHGGKRIIGIGHSFGGSLLACTAVARPELFESLVIIDSPMVFSTAKRSMWHLANVIRPGIVESKHPLIAPCLKKRDHWATREDAVAYMRTKPLFNKLHPEVFDAFVQYGLEADNLSQDHTAHPQHHKHYAHHDSGHKDQCDSHRETVRDPHGVHLHIPKGIEANCYRVVTLSESFPFLKQQHLHPYDLRALDTSTGVNSRNDNSSSIVQSTSTGNRYSRKKLSVHYLYSDKFFFLTPRDIAWAKGYYTNVSFVPFHHNHFWPLEDPDSFSARLVELIAK